MYPVSGGLRRHLHVQYSARSHQFPVVILQYLPCWSVLSVGCVSAPSVSALDAVALIALPPYNFVHQSCYRHWLACEIINCEVTIAFISGISGSRSCVLHIYWEDITCWRLVVSLQAAKNDQMANLPNITSKSPPPFCTVNLVTCYTLLCSDYITLWRGKLNWIIYKDPVRTAQ